MATNPVTYTTTLPSGSGVRQTYTTTEYVTTSPTYVTGQTYTTSTPVYTTGATYTTGAQHGYVNSGLAQGYSSYYPTVSPGYSANLTVGATGQKVVAEQIPVESRIQYIPFEKKYIEYDRVERIQRVPYERQIIQYEQVVHTERVPVQRTITDYYAVETQIQYIPKQIQETIIEYEPVQRTWQRVQYLPVETQIVHYPEREKYVAGQGGKYIQAGHTSSNVVSGSQAYQTTTYQTSTPVTTTAYQTYQTQVPVATSTYQTYQTQVPVSATYQTYQTQAPVTSTTATYQPGYYSGQTFVSGAHGTGSNYVYTTGGYQQSNSFISGGYAQPVSNLGFVTRDGTHITSTGHVVNTTVSSNSQVKNNQSYQTSA